MSSTPPPQVVSQLQVHGVHALSTPSKSVVAACPTADHLVGSLASSFAVIYDTSTDQQVQLLRSTTSNQPLQCLAWSCCGSHLAAGESGNNPSVIVWDVSSGRCVHELKGHRSTVGQLCFSPDGKLLASTGCGADGQLCIWDWHTGSLLCKQKVSVDLSSVAFTEDSSHVLAAGKATLKSWSLSWASPRPIRRRSSSSGASGSDAACSGLSLTARQVTLKQQRQANFVDVRLAPCAPGQPVGSNGVYALTDRGTLLLLRSTGRTVDRAIDLQVQEAFGLAATPKQVACACSQGVVRLFASKSLVFRANLPYLSAQGAAASPQFADARACAFGGGSHADSNLLVVYANHEMVLWDTHNLAQIQPLRCFASHTGSICDVAPFGVSYAAPDGCAQEGTQYVSGCATCGANGTIRFWDMTQPTGTVHPLCLINSGIPSEASSSQAQAATGSSSSTSRVRLCCMRISQDGLLLAAGDTAGNVHVYDISTLQLLMVQEAHDSDVLCLDFSPPPAAPAPSNPATTAGTAGPRGSNSSSSRMRSGRGLAVSGSRDSLIHVYDAHDGFRLLETLDDHQAEVTAVRFTASGRGLVSCGADHSIIFRVLGSSPGAFSAYGYKQRHKETLAHTLLFDLVVDPLDSYVLTADQGGVMRLWDAACGSVLRSIQPEVGAGRIVRLCMDPGGVTAICCHSDGCVRLYDIQTGQLLYRGWGHASHVAAATLSPDLSQLVSVGGDGCIVVWRLPGSLVEQLQTAAAAVAEAREQAGCHVPSPQLLGRQAAGSPISPSPAGTLTPPGGSGLSSRATPGSCVSEGGVSSSTLKRIQRGQPLVSVERLPRWARSPSAANTAAAAAAAAAAAHASEGGAGAGAKQQQQQPQRFSKWLTGRQTTDATQGAGTMSDPGAQAAPSDGPDPPDAANNSSSCLAAQQQPAMPWHQQANRVVVRHWLDGSSFSKEAAAGAAVATAAAAVAQDAAHSGHGQLDQPLLPAPEQQLDLPGKAQPSPAGQGAVVRDLFKSHFSSDTQQQGLRAAKAPEAGEEDDCLAVQQDRQSLSTKFKRERSSLSQVSSPVADMGGLGRSPDAAGAAAGSPRCSVEHSTGLTPQGSNLFRATSTQAPPAQAPPSPALVLPAARPGSAASASDAARLAAKRPCSEEEGASPREKRWRQGQMKPELAGMMERLQSLQAEFVQQQQAAAGARASPARPNSSLGHASPSRKKLMAARRRSDSCAGCTPEGDTEHQQHVLPVPAVISHPAATSPPTSPGRHTPTRPAAAAAAAAAGPCRSSIKQPWASPSAVGSARRTARRSPISSPPPSLTRLPQAAAAARGEGSKQQSPRPVFGSRTLARSMRRKSSAADEEGATAAAAGLKQGSSTAPEPVSPAAAGAASSHAAAAADNTGLMAALFGDDSPAPSPAAAGDQPGRGDCSPGVQQAARSGGAAASTPQAPNTQARLQQLLELDSSPEVSPVQVNKPAATAAATAGGGPQRSKSGSLSPARRSLPRLEEVLRQGSRSPSLSEPSDSSSPDRGALRSPLASSCSPQQQQQQHRGYAANKGRSPSNIPTLQSARKQLLEAAGRLDVSSECRVSIGTSIAARSPAKAAAAGSPLAYQPLALQPHSQLAAAAKGAAGAAAAEQQQTAAAAAKGGAAGAGGDRRGSIDLTPVPASGLLYDNGDTPKVNLGGALTAAALPAAAEAAAAEAAAALPAELAAASGQAGVTVTPAGNHQVWPAWGAEGAWDITPSPGALELKKLWPGAAAGGSQAAEGAAGPCSDASAPCAAAAEASAAEDSAVSITAGEGQAPTLLAASGSSYWVAQNPCYDMTPHGSAGRSSNQHNPEGLLGDGGSDVAVATARSPDTSLLAHPVRDLARGPQPGVGAEGGADSAAGGAGVAVTRGVRRETSYASASSSSPLQSCNGAPVGLLLPCTPPSACGSSVPGSEPGSVSSSRGGSKRQSSAGGRFSGRGLQALLGRSPSPSPSDHSGGPESDCRPGSSAGMLGLLQRMKLGRPKSRSKPSSSAGGGCMSPRVSGDQQEGYPQGRVGSAAGAVPRQQEQQQQAWSGCTSSLAVSADDVQVEVSSRSAASVVQTPPSAAAWAGGAGGVGSPPVAPALQAVAEKLNTFRHSVLEMQALMQELQGLKLDEDSTQELNKLLTPPGQRAHQAAAGADMAAGQPQQAGSTCSSNSSSVPAVPLQQRLQQEVLQTLNELQATIMGLPCTAGQGAGVFSSTPGSPAWIAAHGSGSQQHLLAADPGLTSSQPASLRGAPAAAPGSLRAAAAAGGGGGGSSAGRDAGVSDPDDAYAARILNLVMQKLEGAQPGVGACQGRVHGLSSDA